ncbi:c-type cytochrome [Rubrimonas sp.]|uniref:c-type cytochrome n=1 Tax=Rubrimonas sp. TaxID=2036015 RepID=UPI002FDC9E81
MRVALALALIAAPVFAGFVVAGPVGDRAPVAYTVRDGVEIPEPLAPAGDPERGAAVAADPERGGCLTCHAGPDGEGGSDAPDLAGIGARASEGRLRLAVVHYGALDPDVTEHAFYEVRDLGEAVSEDAVGTTALTAQEVEDLVAWLASLRD